MLFYFFYLKIKIWVLYSYTTDDHILIMMKEGYFNWNTQFGLIDASSTLAKIQPGCAVFIRHEKDRIKRQQREQVGGLQ